MSIDPVHLPPGMHVIAAVKATNSYALPPQFNKKSTVILSSTGKLFLYHPNNVVRALFPILNVTDIEEVEGVERKVIHPWKLLFWKLNTLITICSILFISVVGLYQILDQFSNGTILLDEGVNAPVSSETLTDAFSVLFFNILFALTLGSPLIFSIILSLYVPTYCRPKHIILHQKDGQAFELSEGAEWEGVFAFLDKLWIPILVIIILWYIPPGTALNLVVILGGSSIFGYLLGKVIYWIWEERGTTEVGELRPGNLVRFHRVLNDLLMANTPNEKDSGAS